MLDSAGFLKAGWVHDMVLHRFSEEKFIVKGKVGTTLIITGIDEALAKDVRHTFDTLVNSGERRHNCCMSLHLHGWVSRCMHTYIAITHFREFLAICQHNSKYKIIAWHTMIFLVICQHKKVQGILIDTHVTTSMLKITQS